MTGRNRWHNRLRDGFVGEFAPRPVGDRSPALFWRLASQRHDLTQGFGANLRGFAGSGRIVETFSQRHFGQRQVLGVGPASSPFRNAAAVGSSLRGNLGIVVALHRG